MDWQWKRTSESDDMFVATILNSDVRAQMRMELRDKGQLRNKPKALTEAQAAKLSRQMTGLAERLEEFNKVSWEKMGGWEEGLEFGRNWAEEDDVGAPEVQEDVSSGSESEGTQPDDDGEYEDEEDDMQGRREAAEDAQRTAGVEVADLVLPSTIGQDRCKRGGWKEMLEQEVGLRVAQAGEALEKIRVSLGLKSLLLRSKLRGTKGKKKKTRVWTEVERASAEVLRHVATYRRAKRVVDAVLEPEDPRRRKLRPITQKDLKVVGTSLEEHRTANRSHGKKRKRVEDKGTLAWFWLLDRGEGTDNDSWLEEGKSGCHERNG